MRLIFVYNANSGSLNAVLDSLHKIGSPSTYNCQLCALTFGNFSENGIWKAFREDSDLEMEFYHKDEFISNFRSKWLPKYTFPAILIEQKGELEIFLSSEEINEIDTVEVLIDKIKKRSFLY